VAEDVIGYEDLDDNGEWSDVPEYGHVWYPTTVSVGWTPYHYGHWGWVGAYGWTWIDDAPWGFAPFHYGRWAHIGNRWGWCPGPRSVRPYYAPALVAFIGGGVTISVGGPVGWFPLGPRDVYFPGYRVSRGYFTRVNVSNTIVNTTIINNYYGGYSRGSINYADVKFRNRAVAGAVIAVPGAAFVGARPVHGAAINVGRDTFANARVTAFAPVAPTRASLVASTARPGRAPPARVLDRRIVAATKPPPPVAPFAAREAVLRKNPGRPLTTREIRSLPAEQAGAGNAQVQRRANVKVVTNAGVPARTPAAPLAKRGEGNRGTAERGNSERGAAERGNADNARRAAGNAQERPGRNPGGQDADNGRAAPRGNAPEQRLRSSEFVRGNRGNAPKDNADDGNARRGQGSAAAQDERNGRGNPAAEPPGRNARANPSETRSQRQSAEDQGDNGPSPNPRADRGQQRAAQAQEQQAERQQMQQRAQGQERAQQQRAEQGQMQQRRAQQQEEQQRERSQQAEAQQQRAQQQRAQQAEAQQQRMQQQRAQQAEAQQQRMQQQRAQQEQAQQQRAQQQAQQRPQQQPQQRSAPPQDRGNNERRGKKRDKDDDDGGGR
jgi:hypothetical protein